MARFRISSRNLTIKSSAGARVSSDETPPEPLALSASAPISPKPTFELVSATPRQNRIAVTYLAAESISRGRTSFCETFPKYTFVAPTKSFNALITAGVLMLSTIAACVRAFDVSIAVDKTRSSSPQVCSCSTEYPPGVRRITPLTAWKNSTKTFSTPKAWSICLNPTTLVSPDVPSTPSTGVKSIGSDHWCMRNKNRTCRAVYILSVAPMVMKFFKDLLIFNPSMCRCPV
mmetsp:Transcript_7290/g.27406  ORF Transcript_7290/g.27406 Transcript_7290/m.27406 type:complete len:231 (+) Transcript_7290:4040-4732(+)